MPVMLWGNKFLLRRIDGTMLSTPRTSTIFFNKMVAEDIKYIAQLCVCQEGPLLRKEGFGYKILDEIKGMLDRHNLKLGCISDNYGRLSPGLPDAAVERAIIDIFELDRSPGRVFTEGAQPDQFIGTDEIMSVALPFRLDETFLKAVLNDPAVLGAREEAIERLRLVVQNTVERLIPK